MPQAGRRGKGEIRVWVRGVVHGEEGTRETIVEVLEQFRGEVLAGGGIEIGERIYEVWSSDKDGSWAIRMTKADGVYRAETDWRECAGPGLFAALLLGRERGVALDRDARSRMARFDRIAEPADIELREARGSEGQAGALCGRM